MVSQNPYELLEQIGECDLSVVYRARDLARKRYVTIKQIRDKYRRDTERMQRIWENAAFFQGIWHPRIVRVEGIDQGRGWVILEHLKGSLGARLREGGLPPEEVRIALIQVLEAIEYLHGEGRIHGDIRPSSLLVEEEGWVKLSESLSGSRLGGAPMLVGSPKYSAPEMLNPSVEAVGYASDLYSLGFTALELLRGPRFDSLFPDVTRDAADADLSWARWHTSDQEVIPPVHEVVLNAPSDLVEAIEGMLRKQVGDRIGSAKDALSILKSGGSRATVRMAPSEPGRIADRGFAAGGEREDEVQGRERHETILAPFSSETEAAALPAEFSGRNRQESLGQPSRTEISAHEIDRSSEMPSRKGPAPQSESWRDWINKKLENPWVLMPLLSAIILPCLLYIFWDGLFTPEASEPTTGVASVSKPAGGAGEKTKPVGTSRPVVGDSGKLKTEPAGLKEQLEARENEIATLKKDAESIKKKHKDALGEKDKTLAQREDRIKELEGEVKGLKEKMEAAGVEMAAAGAAPGGAPAPAERVAPPPPPPSAAAAPRPGSSGAPAPTTGVALPGEGQKEWENSVKMVFLRIEPKPFQMGAVTPDDDRAYPNEGPVHTVEISKPYYMGKTEVTQTQYLAVMEKKKNPSHFSDEGLGAAIFGGLEVSEKGNMPVDSVSHQDAVEFCKKLAEKENLPVGAYRLPTEAEWEYAARANSDRIEGSLLDSYAWFKDNSGYRPHGVGMKRANAFGLHDMLGNVAEWCQDWYDENYYRNSPRDDPQGPPDGSSVSGLKILRGGAYINEAVSCRETDRNAADPTHHINSYGFRVVLDPAALTH